MKPSLYALAALALCSAPALASTVLLTAAPSSSSTTTFTDTGFSGYGITGPQTVDGFSVTGSPMFDYGNTLYGFGDNGTWNGFSFIATDEGAGEVTFNLGGSYDSVGLFLNYVVQSGSPEGDDPIITALGTDGTTVLGSYDLFTLAPISTPNGSNAGAFRGIASTSADIGYVEISGDYIAAHSLTLGNAAATVTPEPSSLVLMATGMAGAFGALRRKLRA